MGEQDVKNSSDIYRVFELRTNATRADIANDFHDGSGVQLIAETSPSFDDTGTPTDAVEFYSKKRDRIELNEGVLKYVEGILNDPKSTKPNKQQALLLLNIALFHSEAHHLVEQYGENEANKGKSMGYPIGGEEGYDIEFMLYGLKSRHQPENVGKKDKIPGVRSKNDKLKEGITEGIIQMAKGDAQKTSNLPTVPQGEKTVGSPGTGTGTH